MSEQVEHLGPFDRLAPGSQAEQVYNQARPLTEADIKRMTQHLGHALPPQSISASEVYKEPKTGDDLRRMLADAPDPEPEPPTHVHGPFTFIMNANHNALRGCIACGATWIGLMAGTEENLVWHSVGELPEEQE